MIFCALSNKHSLNNAIKAHQDFHTEAGKIAQTINQGDGARATQMLASGTGFSQASNEVSRLIIQLKNELKRPA